jgi:hypothetical protein
LNAARPIRTPAVLRAIRAPELERYLSRRSVDLLVTDQVEAIKVRIAKGIEVLERKARDGIRAGRRRAAALAATFVVGLLLAGAHAVLAARGRLPGDDPVAAALSLIAACALLAGLVAAMRLAAVIGDMARLRALLLRRHGRGLETAGAAAALLDLAEEALAEARALGAVPPPERD